MNDKLFRSFGALYGLLEQPKTTRRAVIGLLAVHTCMLMYSAYVHSPTLNEPGHLVAGLSHWKFGRFEVYRVNPPLVKMVAALPVMAFGYEEDWSGFYEGPGARPEMGMGEDFVAANGERSFFLFMIARWACIPFSWLGAATCYLWARDLYGRPPGVMACAIWCFEPNILAHASLMTPDIGGTALGVAACYTFWKWLKNPTWMQAALTGVVLGLAELCKTTLILFYPLWPILWVIYRWQDRASMAARDWLREAGMLALRMIIGMYILNLGYGFEGTGTQLKDFHFVSDLFTGRESRVESQEPDDARSNPSFPSRRESRAEQTNRFATSWWGVLPVPLPKNYVLGIDLQQKDFENYGRPSYLRGEWQDHGWWYYYLYATAIKVPLGLWTMAALALVCSLAPVLGGESRVRGSCSFRDTFILLTPPLVIFCVVSSKTGFSEHFRYVLPCFPFLFIWLSQTARILDSPVKTPR
jgi:4-amino-4-deoxy-L-arabinose transferase-like glycosyltransferase